MSDIYRILALLADGQFYSSQKISDLLKIAPSTVRYLIKNFINSDLELQTIRGRGYRIPGGLELLDATAISTAIGEKINSVSLEILNTVDSTNRYLSEKTNAPCGFVCLAEQQTAGRGRHGRTWVSPFGRNLYLSMRWYFPNKTSMLAGLSLAVGVAVANALQIYGLEKIQLKWPNDIVYAGRKLGGILIEAKHDAKDPCQIATVIGVGLNIHLTYQTTRIDQPWIDIYSIVEQRPARNRLAGLVIHELLLMLLQFQEHGLERFRSRWQQLDSLYDQNLTVYATNTEMHGIGAGIDAIGNLLVKQGSRLHCFSSGDVSVRRNK